MPSSGLRCSQPRHPLPWLLTKQPSTSQRGHQMHLRAVKIFASAHGHRAMPKKGDSPLWRSDLRAFLLSSYRHYRFGGTRLFTLT